MKKYSLLFGPLMVILLVLTACSPKTVEATALPETTSPEGIIAEGRVLPVNSMTQSFSIPGQVAEILVKNGDNVKTGQVLARLNGSPESQLALARARQEIAAAQQELDKLNKNAEVNLTQSKLAVIKAQKQLEDAQERYDDDETDENKAQLDAAAALLKQAEDFQSTLEKGKGIDENLYLLAELRLASAEAALASAQAAVDAFELKSNMDGTVVDLTLQVGQRITAGQPVMMIADFSSWVVKTDNLVETDVVNIKVGQKVNIVLDALPGKTISGEVTYINSIFEEKRGDTTYTVTTALDQSDPLVRWGMTAAVQFIP